MDLGASIFPAMPLLPGTAPEKSSVIESPLCRPEGRPGSPSVVGVLERVCLHRREIVCIELDHARRIDERPNQGRA